MELVPIDMLREADSAIPEPGYRPEAWVTRRRRGKGSRAAANARRAQTGRVPRRVASLIRRGCTRLPVALLLAMRPGVCRDDSSIAVAACTVAAFLFLPVFASPRGLQA